MRKSRLRVAGVVQTGGLKIQAPIIFRRILQFEPQFPARASFMSAPDQNCFADVLVDQVHQVQLLSTGNPCGTTARHPFGLISTVHPCAECRSRASSHSTATGTREFTRFPARNRFILVSNPCSLPPDTRFSSSVSRVPVSQKPFDLAFIQIRRRHEAGQRIGGSYSVSQLPLISGYRNAVLR